MRITLHKRIASVAMCLMVGVLASFAMLRPAHAADATCTYTDADGLLSGLTVQNRTVSTQADAAYTTNGAWVDAVACGSPHDFSGSLAPVLPNKLLPGQTAIITVGVNADVKCVGSDATQYCEARILLNGKDIDPDPDHFHLSSPLLADWQTSSFTRTTQVTCPLLALQPCTIGSVQVQFKNDGSTLYTDSLNVNATAQIQTIVL